MKELRRKLKDQSGASILLALLFFLLCSMVGASVLMAAVSNAGKIRSNRAEQQKYLLLSSALRLVCDELTSAEYYGQYTYKHYYKEIPGDPILDAEGHPVLDAGGNPVLEESVKEIYHVYEQTTGDFDCGLKDVLPLTGELDVVFAAAFPPSGDDGTGLIHYEYIPKTGSSPSETHKLSIGVDPSSVDGLGGPENQVTVKVQMDQNLHIWLTATLGGETNGYTMKALLTGQGNLALAEPNSGEGVDQASASAVSMKAGPVKWTLEWIAKKEAGDDT